METRAKLEADLVASFDRDTLTVYADHLQAEGDVRGELIALDLQIDAFGNNVELSKRRTSLLYAWLGSLVPVDNVHSSWVGDTLKFGFIDELKFEAREPNALARLEQVLDSAAGPYVRGLRMMGSAADLEQALTLLSQSKHEWLVKMSIGQLWGASTMLNPTIANAAFAVMPRLESLELRAYAALGPFSHPTIRRLAVRGAAVYAALGDGAKFDRVTELELDLSDGYQQPFYDYDEEYAVEAPEQPEVTWPKIEFPALRRLDLSANNIANIDAAYQFMRTFDARARITTIRIPQLRSVSDQNDLITATRDMPMLETIEVAQGHYYDPPDIPNSKIQFVRAETWPWPTQDLAQGRGLRVYMPGQKFGDDVTLLDAVYWMERQFEKLPPTTRAAWSQLWRAIAQLKATPVEFPARVLAEAVESCPDLMVNGWRELREELSARRPLAADAMVRIERSKASSE